MKANPKTKYYLRLQTRRVQSHSEAFSQLNTSTSSHPSSTTMSPLHRAKPPKEIDPAEGGEANYCKDKSYQSNKLERKYRCLQANHSCGQQAGISEGFLKQGLYLCSSDVS